jgi:hypothetical protein
MSIEQPSDPVARRQILPVNRSLHPLPEQVDEIDAASDEIA